MANPKNGAVVAEPVKRQQIPTGIRNTLNSAFTHWAADVPGNEEHVAAKKKEVLAYINGLLRQLHA